MASFFLVMPFRQVHGVSCCGDMWYICLLYTSLEWNGFLTTSCELWKGRTIWKSQSGNVGAAELAVVLVQSFIFSKKS